MPGVTVLYEDSGGARNQFGLHDLVQRCVADQLGCEPRSLNERLRGHPKNGVGNVLRACRDDLNKLSRGGRAVFAVIDNDQVRQQINLEKTACKAQVVERIRSRCALVAPLKVVLLVQNTETILTTLRGLQVISGRDELFDAAIVRKDINSRDLLFKAAVWSLTVEQRSALQQAMPSMGYLVSRLVTVLGAPG